MLTFSTRVSCVVLAEEELLINVSEIRLIKVQEKLILVY